MGQPNVTPNVTKQCAIIKVANPLLYVYENVRRTASVARMSIPSLIFALVTANVPSTRPLGVS